MGIDEDPPNQKTPIEKKFKWDGEEFFFYQDAVEAVKRSENGKLDKAFHDLFPSADSFNRIDYFSKDVTDDIIMSYRQKYNTDVRGVWISLLLEERLASDPDTSTVHFPSIEALITKSPKRKPRQKEPEFGRGDRDILRDGFAQDYIDPHGYVVKITGSITENMTNYCNAEGTKYIAPYTSLVPPQ
jgi:hypothetical protein